MPQRASGAKVTQLRPDPGADLARDTAPTRGRRRSDGRSGDAAAAAAGLVPFPALNAGPADCSGAADAARRRRATAAGADRAGRRTPANRWNVPAGTAQPSLPAASPAGRRRRRPRARVRRRPTDKRRVAVQFAVAPSDATELHSECPRSIGTGRRTSAA